MFLSDFGRERLAEEKELGPAELRGGGRQEGEDSEEDTALPDHKKTRDAEAAAMARVRKYQVGVDHVYNIPLDIVLGEQIEVLLCGGRV